MGLQPGLGGGLAEGSSTCLYGDSYGPGAGVDVRYSIPGLNTK